jgi:cytoskeleton protein RodZ
MNASQGNDVQPEDGSASRSSIGSQLRAAREQRQLDIDRVAGELHLDVDVIKALENDDSEALPAPIFVQGYLRSYARLLDLPADEIVRHYTEQTAEPPPLSVIRVDRNARFSRLPSVRLVRNLILLLLVVILAWLAWPVAERFLDGRGQPAEDQAADFLTLPPADR